MLGWWFMYSIATATDGGESIVTMRTAVLLLCAVTFPAWAELSGRVVSSEGPLEGVVVSAKHAGTPVTVSVVSGADGRFPRAALTSLPRGRLVSASGRAPFLLTQPRSRLPRRGR